MIRSLNISHFWLFAVRLFAQSSCILFPRTRATVAIPREGSPIVRPVNSAFISPRCSCRQINPVGDRSTLFIPAQIWTNRMQMGAAAPCILTRFVQTNLYDHWFRDFVASPPKVTGLIPRFSTIAHLIWFHGFVASPPKVSGLIPRFSSTAL